MVRSLLVLSILLLSIGVNGAGDYSGADWRVLLDNTIPRGEPYKNTFMAVKLDGCGETAPTDVYWMWNFGGARTDLGEVDSSVTMIPNVLHEFRGTGRRRVTVSACIESVVPYNSSNLVWCQGDIITAEFEFIVQYVRRSLRDLSQEEWDQHVEAAWIIKTNSEQYLQDTYGFHCHSYDWITSFHYAAATNSTCEQGHVWTAFLPFHRSFTRLYELSIQSIYPHLSLAYWDQAYDGLTYSDPAFQSPIFGDAYFGGEGDPNDLYQVKNGRFVGWPAGVPADWLDLSKAPAVNPFGYLRAPWNPNPAPTFSRIFNNTLGFVDPRGKITWFNITKERACLEITSGYTEFFYCFTEIFEGGHGWVHLMLGGMRNSFAGTVVTPFPDSPIDQYRLLVFRTIIAAMVLNTGATQCPSACDPTTITPWDIGTCHCTCSTPSAAGLAKLESFAAAFGFLPPLSLNVSSVDNLCNIGGFSGDFMDSTSSPNDPLFHYFHSDLDRIWQTWQARHLNLGLYGGFPEVGFCVGHGLHDRLLGESGPTALQLGLGTENRSLTIAELIERTLPPEFGTEMICPYTFVPYSQWNGQGITTMTTPVAKTDNFCQDRPPAPSASASVIASTASLISLFFLWLSYC